MDFSAKQSSIFHPDFVLIFRQLILWSFQYIWRWNLNIYWIKFEDKNVDEGNVRIIFVRMLFWQLNRTKAWWSPVFSLRRSKSLHHVFHRFQEDWRAKVMYPEWTPESESCWLTFQHEHVTNIFWERATGVIILESLLFDVKINIPKIEWSAVPYCKGQFAKTVRPWFLLIRNISYGQISHYASWHIFIQLHTPK